MFVVIVDEKENRRKKVAKLICDKWRLRVIEDKGIDGGLKIVHEISEDKSLHPIAAKILWWSKAVRIQRIKQEIIKLWGASFELLQIEDEDSTKWVDKNISKIAIPEEFDEDDLESKLKDILGSKPKRPEIVKIGSLDERVEQLIKSLGTNGKYIIEELIFQLFPDTTIDSLNWVGEGYSDSILFLLALKDKQGVEHKRVLKLTPASKRQMCIDEFINCSELNNDERNKKHGRLLPQLYYNKSGAGTELGVPGIAEYKNEWIALAYEYLGAKEEQVVSLAYSYLNPRDECFQNLANKQDPAEYILSCCLQYLQAEWYNNGEIKKEGNGGKTVLWSNDNINANLRNQSFPPYRFGLLEKRKISTRLKKLKHYGSLALSSWKEDANSVFSILWEGITCLENKKVPVIISRTHGDLNGGNMLCDIIRPHPFLVDFSCYKPSNHTLQDFARLETEIKFIFMDCGLGQGGCQSGDLCPRLLDSWVEVEIVLCDDNWSEILDVSHTTISRCGLHAVKLINHIRRKAYETQKMITKNETKRGLELFILSYFAALLYETLRVTTFDTPPLVKRMFAVHSASCILKRIEQECK